MITAALRLLFCVVLIGLLPAGAWACADMAVAAQAAAIQPTGAPAPAAAADATFRPDSGHLGALLATPPLPALCDNCQYCPQCHTPALTPNWRLAMAPAESLPIRQDAAAGGASATPRPRLKPPIS